MGGAQSSVPPPAPTPDALRRAAWASLSRFERMSLSKKTAAIGDNVDALLAELRIRDAPGAGVLLRMANRLAPETGAVPNLGLAICWFDGRLAAQTGLSELEWRQHIFEAVSVAEVGGEPYIQFQELVDLTTLLLSAFDSDPRDQASTQIDLIDAGMAGRLLDSVKAPAVRFAQFISVLEIVPYLLAPLANIWERLLYDPQSTVAPSPVRISATLPRSYQALLFGVVGPQLLASLLLYQGTTNGFSMRAFEVGVTKWPSSTVLVLSGHQPRNYAKWKSKSKDVDKVVPRFYDAPVRPAKKLVFALLVDEPWKASYKHCFGKHPVLLQLEPEFRSWRLPASTVFMAPNTGLGAGFIRPPTENDRTRGTVLFVDSCMEHGVLRYAPDFQDAEASFEYRFYLDQVEVLGCGSQQDLEKQQRAWAWEDAEANRRRTVNVQEDRALLEMAGLVGQYSH